MLAGYFVADGVAAINRPELLTDDMAPLARAVTQTARRLLPESASAKIPQDTAAYVRIHGAIQAVGGVMVATGFLRRFGAGLIALAYLPRVIAARPRIKSLTTDQRFLREVALLGGVVIAAMDTQGKPNLAWLAADRSQQLSRASARFIDQKKTQLAHTSAQVAADLGQRVQTAAKTTKRGARRAAVKAQREAQRIAAGLARHQ